MKTDAKPSETVWEPGSAHTSSRKRAHMPPIELITRGELDVVKIATATRITDASVKKLLATARKGLSDPVIPEEHKHKQGRRKAARRRVTSGEERAS